MQAFFRNLMENSNSVGQLFGVFRAELRKAALIQCRTDSGGQLIIKVQVMHNGQTHGQHFTCHKQMAQVGTGKGTAHRAVTVRVNGALIQLILFIFDIQCALSFP